jgi:importin subunit beta-1
LREKIVPVSNSIMEECLKVILAYQQVKRAQVLHQDALALATAMTNAVGANFDMFMSHFLPHLTVGLQNFEDVQVCLNSTGAVADIARALGQKMTPYCDQILELLFKNLQNIAVDRKIKASIMAAFGMIAMAIAGDFEKYLGPVVNMLQYASSTRFADGPTDNEEWIEYLNNLREGILDAYTDIILGLRDDPRGSKLHLFKEHTNGVLMLVKTVTEEEFTSEAVMKAAVGVVGDLISVFKAELTSYVGSAPFLLKLLSFASSQHDPKTQETAQWLKQMLVKFGVGGPN